MNKWDMAEEAYKRGYADAEKKYLTEIEKLKSDPSRKPDKSQVRRLAIQMGICNEPKYEFDLDTFIACCKECGIKIEKGSGKILIEDKEVRISEIIEEKLALARSNMKQED